jgi:hypothetical protein
VYWERDINGIITTIGPSTNPNKYGGSTTVNPSLTINNVDFSDEGNYRCYATNIVGTGNSKFFQEGHVYFANQHKEKNLLSLG